MPCRSYEASRGSNVMRLRPCRLDDRTSAAAGKDITSHCFRTNVHIAHWLEPCMTTSVYTFAAACFARSTPSTAQVGRERAGDTRKCLGIHPTTSLSSAIQLVRGCERVFFDRIRQLTGCSRRLACPSLSSFAVAPLEFPSVT